MIVTRLAPFCPRRETTKSSVAPPACRIMPKMQLRRHATPVPVASLPTPLTHHRVSQGRKAPCIQRLRQDVRHHRTGAESATACVGLQRLGRQRPPAAAASSPPSTPPLPRQLRRPPTPQRRLRVDDVLRVIPTGRERPAPAAIATLARAGVFTSFARGRGDDVFIVDAPPLERARGSRATRDASVTHRSFHRRARERREHLPRRRRVARRLRERRFDAKRRAGGDARRRRCRNLRA